MLTDDSQVAMIQAMITLPDHEQKRLLDELLAATVDGDSLLRKEWLGRDGRVAVLLPSWSHFSKAQANDLAEAMRISGHTECYGIAAEDLSSDEDAHWRVNASEDDLLAFSQQTNTFSSALIAKDGSFVVICTSDEYLVIAGNPPFVEKACGGSLEAARKSFRKFAHYASGAPQEWLHEVADRYGC